ncbi:hypothetical protein DPMN_146290 [Dreissena polymorpha]|uniref:Mutator-like transposase domain-containing protein n=1 Tax=Dreissena polymorpha TaxID=45954 RepID=A0A9D4FA18_DREPO|nr:hypothetical protein DPMN_146290 [Dreissena polymorpha]
MNGQRPLRGLLPVLPVPLTFDNVVDKLQKWLGGYLYVVCLNVKYGAVNRVPYGTTHHIKSRGMPCFEVNTKLRIAMIDVLGGAVKFNNFLSAPDIKEVHPENLMKNRAREFVEAVAKESAKDRSGEDGLLDIFTMKNSDGQPRVTSMKKVLDKVLPKGATFFIT